MAANMTQEKCVAIATSCKQRLELLVRTFNELQSMIEFNSDNSIDWGNGDLSAGGDAISVDAKGNISGLNFTPAQLSNALFSAEQIVRVLTNQTTTQGDHLGNLNVIVDPVRVRADRI